MSGDVQPRKRKDKRRKKEGDGFLANESATFHKPKSHGDGKPSDFIEPGERIHIQNEQGIGGNICFKIVFFCLLFVLLSGIGGIVYKLSQDSTDVEPVSVEESRFAEYFASWVDDTSNDHEHEVPETTHDDEENADGGEDEEEEEGPDSNQDDETHESEDLSNGPDLLSSFFNFGGNEETVANSNPIEESNEVPQEDDNDDKDNVNNDDDDDDNDNDENDFGDKENISENGDDNEIEDDGGGDDDDDKINVKISSVKEKLKKLKSFYSHKFNKHVIGGDSLLKSPKRKWKKLPNFKFDFKNYVSEDDDEINDDEDDEEKNYDASQEDENDNNNQYKAVKTTLNDENYQKDDDGHKEKEDEPSYESEEKKDVEIDELKQKNEIEEPNEETDRFKNDDLGYDEIDESYESDREESFEKEETETTGEENAEHLIPPTVERMPEEESQVTTQENNKEENNEKMTEETGGVIVKLGVGFALIIVAHLVLVQKWKARGNVTSDEVAPVKESLIENLNSEPEPIISRRQTLVPENVNFEDLDNIDEEEYLDEDGEENDDYAEGDEELEEEEDENTEEEEGYEEHVDKDNGNVDKSLCDKKLSLEDLKSRENRYVEKLDVTKSSFENIENDLEILDGEEELEEEEEDYDNEYGEEEEYEEEYDAGIYGEEEEEESESFEMDIDDRVMSRSKNSKIEEDVTPVPPPRLHKRGGQSEENELENRSDEVLQQGHYPADAIDESVADELESETNPMEKKVGDEEDWSFRQEFQYAEEQFENNPKAALRTYEEILSKKPTNLKALINRARVLDDIAERERSNAYLKQATHAYKTLLIQEGHRLDDDEFEKLSDRCISRMRFGGHHTAAIDIHKSLIARFPDDPKHRNALAVTYLMLNHIEPARWVLNETLTRWPRNGFALVHYGFIVKTTDNNMEEGAKLLMDGIKTKEEGVNDGMFFFHLGDALNRLGRGKEALEWYDEGVKEGLFLSRYQRSLYNINRLKGRPWWTKEQTTYKDFFDLLEKNWKEIRGEGLNLLNLKGVSLFKEESENLKDTGDWRQLDLFFRGRKQANCEKAPITCSLVSSFKPASRCTRGQIKFSVMLPKTHVWPHCGPTNCRLRSHLGLIIPGKTFIRVAEETRSWEEGKVMVFDDSFEHEVWHNGTGLRLVLIVDVWHPEVTEHERRSLSPI